MDAAAAAMQKILPTGLTGVEKHTESGQDLTASNKSNAGGKDTTITQDVAPAVEHETIKREHETKEHTVIDREKHQHHYQTVEQPLKDREVESTQHEHEVAPTQYREIDHDDTGTDVKAKHEAEQAAFQDQTVEGATMETKTNEGTFEREHVHHHLHQTIQPVVEKETIKPSVTHKTIPVKEVINEGTQDHGIVRKEPISVDDFNHRLDGEAATERKVEGLQKSQ